MQCGSSMPMAFALSDRLLQATFRMAKLRNSVCFAKGLLPEITSDAVCPAHIAGSSQHPPFVCCADILWQNSGQDNTFVLQQMSCTEGYNQDVAGGLPMRSSWENAEHSAPSAGSTSPSESPAPQGPFVVQTTHCAQCPFPLLFLEKRCKPSVEG